MDPYVQLALMAKAKKIFETEETFLSFPALSGIAYTESQFRALQGSALTPQSLQLLSELSRLTNIIPRGALFDAAGSEYLWEVYADVLARAELAAGTLSPQENAQYRAALGVLYQHDRNGRPIDSAKVLLYKQHRDALIVAQEAYRCQQATAEAASESAVLTRWREVDEPSLRQRVQQASDDWRVTGCKAEVEAARQVEQACAARSPALKWSEWRTAFEPRLDMLTDAGGQAFALTGLSPVDVLDGADWARFTMSGDEIQQAVKQAPGELKRIFGSAEVRSGIDTLSFEYRSVGVTRPWFFPALFSSRFWRLDDRQPRLSNGADPPSGRCTAYTAALVLVRKVTLTRRRTLAEVSNAALDAVQPRVLQNLALRPEVGAQALKLFDSVRPIAGAIGDLVSAASEDGAVEDLGSAVERLATSVFSALLSGGAPAASPEPRPGPSTPAPEPASVTTLPPDSISILAFVCKRLPRCPDPDPQLPWGA
jgi:hypothetical protein